MRNARFWIWHSPGDCWVKLTLRPGQTLSFGYGGRTDEGWSYHSETYSHDGDYVSCEVENDGVDCDGRLSSCNRFTCSIHDLAAREVDDRHVPEWTRVHASWRDYEAEKAGY